MNNFYGNYAANATFRNQPNYSYFDKRMREDNPLYGTLNELDDYFLKPKYLLDQSKYVTENVVDPRTNQLPPALIINHGLHAKPAIFSSFIGSSMNFEKHSWGVQIIYSLQMGESIIGEDLHKLNDLNTERQTERNQFLKFSYNYYLKNKKQLIASTKPLYALYSAWYTNRKTKLKQIYVNKSYNTLLGLPHTKICKSVFGGGKVHINQPVEVAREGFLWKELPEEERRFNITNHNLNSYMEEYMKSEKILDKLETNLKHKFLKDVKSSLITYPKLYIPFESLLFLLVAGEYSDLPTEMFLEVKEEFSANKVDLQKLIIMDEPLPARICGWHTYKKIIENASMVASSINMPFNLQHSVPVRSALKPSEASNQLNDTVIEYKPLKLCDYFAKFGFRTIEGKAKFTKVLCNWCLELDDDEDVVGIYTSANILGEAATDPLQQMHLYSIKMEYKSALGCEIMTKYELLREWFLLKLLNISKSTCYRLDINDCNLLAKEVLTLQRIEEIMFNIYQINSSQIFSNLNEFLKLLLNMPTGQYILRYNTKFPDKFMLCQPSQETTQNTIYLHSLIDLNPSDLLFISNNNYLPIADNICSTVHMTHNVLPCAFYPKREKFVECNHCNNSEGHSKEFTDRKNVLHRASVKKASVLKTKQSLRRKAGNLRRKYKKRTKMMTTNQISEKKRELEEII